MLLLAIDTCDSRGSVALLRDETMLNHAVHEDQEEYSSWLMVAVDTTLKAAGHQVSAVDVFAVATGPGSFTGARIGLTAVKAWSEVYAKPIAGISRLEALASQADPGGEFVAAFFDGSRNQVFGALYRRHATELQRVGDDLVLTPSEFVIWVDEQSKGATVRWASIDPEKLTAATAWKTRADRGETILRVSSNLAPIIGKMGYARALRKNLTDALTLDANYVRRTDAEVFWGNAGKSQALPK